jgi:hypothetical protein
MMDVKTKTGKRIDAERYQRRSGLGDGWARMCIWVKGVPPTKMQVSVERQIPITAVDKITTRADKRNPLSSSVPSNQW